MANSIADMLAAARAAVPAITPAEAADLVRTKDALLVDVRDGTEVKASGKAKGAVAVSRGLLEFRADPASPNHDPAFRTDRPLILYCGSGGRAALAGKTLQDLGFTDVRNVGGFKDWVAAGGEVEPG
ncbi:MAG TPA: rhodanese-like domain-containing protein [Acetobacteraceae bacterium]|jgi:rhodanese-related sulfurtransferase|nr:rhodanese-like domain-containing protein [Acetobacteraceae bacterium]